jgi:hypothetical protein
MQLYLINALIFCGLLLLLALAVAVVQLILILNDLRQLSKQARDRAAAFSPLFDLAALFLAGGKQNNLIFGDNSIASALFVGLKKALQILFKDKRRENCG